MKIIRANETRVLPLSHRGENLAHQIVFDVLDWVAEYGAGTAELIVQRPCDTVPYPAPF